MSAKWQPIEKAPKDGGPVWARGHRWGNPGNPKLAGWVYWDGLLNQWLWAGGELNLATHVIEYLPTASQQSAPADP